MHAVRLKKVARLGKVGKSVDIVHIKNKLCELAGVRKEERRRETTTTTVAAAAAAATTKKGRTRGSNTFDSHFQYYRLLYVPRQRLRKSSFSLAGSFSWSTSLLFLTSSSSRSAMHLTPWGPLSFFFCFLWEWNAGEGDH